MIVSRFLNCPNCSHRVNLTVSAELQAERLGVLCECSQCKHTWLHKVESRGGNEPPPPAGGPHAPSPKNPAAAPYRPCR